MKPIKAAIISITGTELTDNEQRLIAQERPFGIALFSRNINTPQQLQKLTWQIKETAESDDILIAVDQEGGRVCRLTSPYWRNYMSQAAMASLSAKDAEKAAVLHAELIADDLHLAGINCNFAPTLDVATPNITVALKSRCFSSDERLTAKLGKCIFDTYHHLGIVPCIKHFPGHSGAEADPHLQLSVIENINEKHFYPFEQITPRALMGMTAHIVLKQFDTLPATLSAQVIQNLIRGRFDFKGILLSDALEMKALSGSLQEKTATAIKAGCDVVSYCKGDESGNQNVLSACGFLSDAAMDTWDEIKKIFHQPYQGTDIKEKETQYQVLAQQALSTPDDYDAVEVLQQL